MAAATLPRWPLGPSTEPLADFALSKLRHHLFLDHARKEQLAVELELVLGAEATRVKAQGVVREHFRHDSRR